MMRKIAVLGLALAAALAAPANAQSLVGEWTATAHTANGDFSEALSVTKEGSGYKIGSKPIGATAAMPEAPPATDIVLDGDKFAFKRTIGQAPAAIEITYIGTVSGDAFSGTVEMGGTKVPYTGVRTKAGK